MFRILAVLLLFMASHASAQQTIGPVQVANPPGISPTGDASNATAMATASTTPRTLAARAADFFNVRDNGIVCDGTTDTSGAVGAMMTKVSSAGGGDVFWPAQAQPCMIGSYFSVPSNVRLWAAPGTVILMATATNTSNPTLISISGTSYLRINGLTLDGNVSNNTTLSNFITVYQASNVIFSDVTVQNTNGIGLLFSTNVSNSGVLNSTFNNVGGFNPTLDGVQRRQGVAFCCGTTASNTGNFVRGSHFSEGGLDLISISSQTGFIASNNFLTTTSGGACIYVAGSVNIDIDSNQCDHASGNGMDGYTNTNIRVLGGSYNYNGGGGVQLASTTTGKVSHVTANNNWQSGASVHQAGFVVGGETGSAASSDLQFIGNTAGNTGSNTTQQWGIQVRTPATVSALWVDQSNNFTGNAVSDFGQQISGYTAQKVSATVTSIAQFGTAPNQGISLLPTGTGAVTAAVPDSTAAGGNVRGSQAVDWQQLRSSNAHVAASPQSVISGGSNNSVGSNAQWAWITGGEWNVANGVGCGAAGGFASCMSRAWGFHLAGVEFATQGDNQLMLGTIGAPTTSATAVKLTSSNITGVAGAGNILNIPNNHGLAALYVCNAHTRAGTDYKSWWGVFHLDRGANAAATVLPAMTQVVIAQSSGASAWALSSGAADTTNGGLTLTGAGAASTNVDFHCSILGSDVG